MSDQLMHIDNEQAAAMAFNKQAVIFDSLYDGDLIIQYKRDRVRQHVMQLLPANSSILELNAGTGDDAIFFAKGGHTIHATDISDIMQNMLKEKVRLNALEDKISSELRSFTELGQLMNRGPYDLIFSNFAGLNCTQQLEKVLTSFHPLLKPGGIITLVILPRFCLWESLMLFRGKFRTAFRRFSGKKGTKAHVEGQHFRCWYYNPSFIKRVLKNKFSMLKLEGLCTIVPPSYIEKFGEKHPRLFQFLRKTEDKWKANWPWRAIGDYYIITLRKNC